MSLKTLNDIMRDLAATDQGEITANQARNLAPAALLADETLAQLVCVWPGVPVAPFTPEQLATVMPPETPPHRALRWAFAQLEPDPVPYWIEMTGLPDAPHVRRAVYLAIDNRLVHPDGQLSTWAKAFAKELLKNVIVHAGAKRRGGG